MGELCNFICLNQGKNIWLDFGLKLKFWGHHGHCEIEFLEIIISVHESEGKL